MIPVSGDDVSGHLAWGLSDPEALAKKIPGGLRGRARM